MLGSPLTATTGHSKPSSNAAVPWQWWQDPIEVPTEAEPEAGGGEGGALEVIQVTAVRSYKFLNR